MYSARNPESKKTEANARTIFLLTTFSPLSMHSLDLVMHKVHENLSDLPIETVLTGQNMQHSVRPMI